MNTPFLSKIFLYPIKSLAGFAVDNWPVTNTGLLYDRKWMLVDPDGNFLSQRRLPKMALITTAIKNQQLILSAPKQEDLILDLNPANSEFMQTKIWADNCIGNRVSTFADVWLSEFLNTACHLVYQADTTIRPVDSRYANSTDAVGFADGFPFLLLAEASLTQLNKMSDLQLSILRFRPNLVIDNCKPHAEDYWREINIGAINFRLPKPCSRCNVPNIDPKTAQTNKEPLRTLSKYRQWQHKIYFGQNAIHNKTGSLNSGDKVMILQSSTAQPPL